MKKRFKLGWIFSIVLCVTACQKQNEKQDVVALDSQEVVVAEDGNQKEPETIDHNNFTYENVLDDYDSTMMERADAWTNGSVFDCIWRKDNIRFEEGIMSLTIDLEGEGHHPKYSGAEYRTRQFYQYGLYEVKMKPIKNDGVVSSFFVYTGPSDGNAWDEIDIEFLGKDTTKVQFNYFADGVGNHEFIYDLGYDASDEFHEYGFEWKKDSIIWYVDHEPVHTATTNLPKTPAKIMMNVWPGTGVDGWLNAYDGTTPLTAQYDWFRYSEFTGE